MYLLRQMRPGHKSDRQEFLGRQMKHKSVPGPFLQSAVLPALRRILIVEAQASFLEYVLMKSSMKSDCVR